MDEFNNRIDAQRIILGIINSRKNTEPLFGLSKGAIERWGESNNIVAHDRILEALYILSSKLFFLANKSQEQISEAYLNVSSEIQYLIDQLRDLIAKNRVSQ